MTNKQWILLTHLGTLLGYTIVLGSFLVPLFIWFSKKDEAPEIAEHAKESLNFQISVAIYSILSIPLVFIGVGVVLLLGLVLLNVACVILASVEADKGGFYRYPLTIRLIR